MHRKNKTLTLAVLLFTISMVSTSFMSGLWRNILQDYKMITGSKWTGTLTYRDYSSGKQNTIRAELEVIQSPGNRHVFYRSFLYPDEPRANSRDTVLLSRDGKMLGAETIIHRNRWDKNKVEWVTEKITDDDGVQKIFRYTYEISPRLFSVKKQERSMQDTGFIERNTYTFRRN